MYTNLLILTFLLIINLITLIAFRADKKRAASGESNRRISEKRLIQLGLFGGSLGGLAGIYRYRHKTQKLKFTLLFPIFLILHLGILIANYYSGMFL